MANEKRLIDANALLEKGYWHGKHPDWENPFAEGVDAVDTIDIENAPTVDAVEVVRCGNCKYRHDYDCPMSDRPISDNDYCSYGENKNEDLSL